METNYDIPALAAILKERRHQLEKGYTPEHDASYVKSDLLRAALCYLIHLQGLVDDGGAPDGWPWEQEFWKPTAQLGWEGRKEEAAKAGALLVAEYQRLHAGGPDIRDAVVDLIENVNGGMDGTYIKTNVSWLQSACTMTQKCISDRGDNEKLVRAIACTVLFIDKELSGTHSDADSGTEEI